MGRPAGRDGESGQRSCWSVHICPVAEAELWGRPAGRDGESGQLSCADNTAVTVLSVYFDTALQSVDGGGRLALLHALAGGFPGQ